MPLSASGISETIRVYDIQPTRLFELADDEMEITPIQTTTTTEGTPHTDTKAYATTNIHTLPSVLVAAVAVELAVPVAPVVTAAFRESMPMDNSRKSQTVQ